MIIKASQRGNGTQLANHLMNIADNDHITVHEVRGFVANSLLDAFNEAHAISKATKAKQFLLSVSFNPPHDQDVGIDTFLDAIERAESALGLSGQPRAIIFHEKEGRRHAHAVWSRIDAAEMKAVNLPFFKSRLNSLSKELYLENGWELPRGFRENWKNPLNYTLAEFQQAKRIGVDDPREIKQIFREAFQQSDSAKAFKAALEDSGFYLAKGDRRGMVAVDLHGKVYSAPRWAGIKTKEFKSKFPDTGNLPSVDQTKSTIEKNLSSKMRGFMAETRADFKADMVPLHAERTALVADQRIARAKLKRRQAIRAKDEAKDRAARYRKGLMGVYDLLIGKQRAIRTENEADLLICRMRDRNEREDLFSSQIKSRRALQEKIERAREVERTKRKALTKKIAEVLNITREFSDQRQRRERTLGRDRSLDLSL